MRIALLVVLLFSAYIQFSIVSRTVVDTPLRADAKSYFSYAYNLKNYGVYSNAATWSGQSPAIKPAADKLSPPGYPLFLLAVGNPEPTEDFVSRVTYVQAVLAVLSVWLMYLISARFLGPRWALAAATLTALSPHLAVMTSYILTETLFIFLLFASLLSLLVAIDSKKRVAIVATGLLWGLCSLVRPTAQFVPLLALLAVVALPRLRQFRKEVLLGFAVFIAVQAPWQIRNHFLESTPGQPSLMVNFLNFGAYPNFMYQDRPESFAVPYRFDPDINTIQHDLPSFISSISGKFRHQPVKYARWYLIGKPGYFLSWTNIDGVGDVYIYPVIRSPYFEDMKFALVRFGMLALHWPLMLLGLLGGMAAWLRPEWARLDESSRMAAMAVSGLFAYALVFHMIGAPLPRYGIPFRPLLYPLALLVLRGWWLKRLQK